MMTNLYDTIYGTKTKRQPVGRSQKGAVRIKQKGRCKDCHKVLVIEDYHHIKHVAKNGKSVTGNLVALCPECHRKRHIKEKAMSLDKTRTRRESNNILGLKIYKPKKID